MGTSVEYSLAKAWREAINGSLPEADGKAAFTQLAEAKFEGGYYVEALAALLRASETTPLSDPDLNRLAWCYLFLGQPAPALSVLNQAETPDLLAKARAYGEVGDFDEALEALQNAPITPKFLLAKAVIFEGLGDTKNAQAHFNTLKFAHQDFLEVLFKKTDRFIATDYFQEATKTLNQMEKFARADAETFYDMGQRYFMMNKGQDAERVLRKGIAARPLPKIYQELALFYERSNRLDQAMSFITVALQAAPEDPFLKVTFGKILLRAGRQEEALIALEEAEKMSLSPLLHSILLGEKGKALEKLETFDKAFEAFASAKQPLRKTDEYQSLKLETPYSNTKSFDGLDLSEISKIKRHQGKVEEPGNIVFFMGFPRSGTTLIQTILDSHEKTALLEERPALATPIRAIKGLGQDYPREVLNLTPAEVAELRDLYLLEAGNFVSFDSETVLIDKLPLHTLHIPLIKTLFPESKIIFSVRHPKGVSWSCLVQHFSLNNSMAHMFSLDEISKFYDMNMRFWKKTSEDIKFDFHQIRYEDLVDNLEKEVKQLCRYLDLEFNEDMLTYAERAKDKGLINTPSYSQVVKPIYRGSIDHWKNYANHFKPYADRLDPWCLHFGYEVD